ncbi:MAG: protein phosphatase [Betaproteobacteria bacterium HGW-Betaproteobacteria-22]|nr:MAG: protein phosphatase [Betaproteobacteria bacterium HGW-Betaproteobacteria-22]
MKADQSVRLVESKRAVDLSDALDIVRLTDVGLLRSHNEDAVASDASIGFVMLADGMGGYQAGEVASEIAVLTIAAELKEAIVMAASVEGAGDNRFKLSPSHIIEEAVSHANDAIYRVSQEFAQCAGMGTTLVVGLFANNHFVVGHVGDSRAYRLRKHVLTQITEDHSLLQEQINAGLLSKEQAKFSTYRNLVTRAVGIEPDVELEIHTHDVEVGDIYLLCSDGLTDLVDDEAIASVLNTPTFSLYDTARALINLANEHGGKDNISVILAKVNASFDSKEAWFDSFLGWIK